MPARILAGAMCVQRFDDSLNSAIHITYRISLRSSSMPEPRDPLLKVLIHLCFEVIRIQTAAKPVRGKIQEFGSSGGGRVVRLTPPGKGSGSAGAETRRSNDKGISSQWVWELKTR
jgi:hypothetical protein